MKQIRDLKHLPYAARLRERSALSLFNRRTFTDMVTVFKHLHGTFDVDIGLVPVESNGARLTQFHPTSKNCANLFAFITASTWNKLPQIVVNIIILIIKTIGCFKNTWYKHYLQQQT